VPCWREIKLEDAPRDDHADERGAEGGEHAGEYPHGEEFDPLRAAT